MNQQSMEFAVWLGIAVLALIWANLSLVRSRRLLKRLRQDSGAAQVRVVPTTLVPSILVPSILVPAVLAPAVFAISGGSQSASSVPAR